MSAKPFSNIATAIAFSPNMEANVHESLRITKMLGHKLFLIHVGITSPEEKNRLTDLVQSLELEGTEVQIVWQEGEIINAIIKTCKANEINLLIAGAQPREGILRYYMGSVARRLVRKTTCSILLMTHPSKLQSRCGKIVVNGINHPKTKQTIKAAFYVANCIKANELLVVEEVVPDREMEDTADDAHLRKANAKKTALVEKESQRLKTMVSDFEKTDNLRVNTKIIFGKRGYTIGHFTQSACADLLVMNSPDTKLGFLDRVFTHDLEYVLSELPSDLLIVHSQKP